MPVYRRYCLLLLVALASELSLGTVNVSKSGCLGDSMELFQNIGISNANTACSLYIDRKKDGPIAIWSMTNSVINPTFVNGYSDKFFFDKLGNLWIRDLHDSDNAGYSIMCSKENVTSRDDVKLDVLVAPGAHCKPKILRGVDTLSTYLDANGCGKPAAYAYFLEEPGYVRNEIKLHRQEANTFYACIDGPALKCAKNLKLIDYCTVFTDEGWVQSRVSQPSGVTTDTVVIIICVTGVGVLSTVIILLCIRRMQKRNIDSKRLVIQKENQHLDTSNEIRNPESVPFVQSHNVSEPVLTSTPGFISSRYASNDTGVGSRNESSSTVTIS